jgi:hypothetical protein
LATVALVTIAVHAAAELVIEGQITGRIFGHPSIRPDPREDFTVAILKV